MVKKIIDNLERKNIIRDLCANMRVLPNDIDDFVQEIYIILLEYDSNKIIDMYNNNQLKFFLVGVIQRQYNSCTSPYYKKYKKYYNLIDANTVNNNEMMYENEDLDD
jgi:hypothetical protein